MGKHFIKITSKLLLVVFLLNSILINIKPVMLDKSFINEAKATDTWLEYTPPQTGYGSTIGDYSIDYSLNAPTLCDFKDIELPPADPQNKEELEEYFYKEQIFKGCLAGYWEGELEYDNEKEEQFYNFYPERDLTREELAKMIGRIANLVLTPEELENIPEEDLFTDVDINHWSAKFIYKFKKIGIIEGKTSQLFAPKDKITIAESIKIMLLAFGFNPSRYNTTNINGYPENAWYLKYANFAREKGFLLDQTSDHQDLDTIYITRKEIVHMLMKAKEKALIIKLNEINDYWLGTNNFLTHDINNTWPSAAKGTWDIIKGGLTIAGAATCILGGAAICIAVSGPAMPFCLATVFMGGVGVGVMGAVSDFHNAYIEFTSGNYYERWDLVGKISNDLFGRPIYLKIYNLLINWAVTPIELGISILSKLSNTTKGIKYTSEISINGWALLNNLSDGESSYEIMQELLTELEDSDEENLKKYSYYEVYSDYDEILRKSIEYGSIESGTANAERNKTLLKEKFKNELHFNQTKTEQLIKDITNFAYNKSQQKGVTIQKLYKINPENKPSDAERNRNYYILVRNNDLSLENNTLVRYRMFFLDETSDFPFWDATLSQDDHYYSLSINIPEKNEGQTICNNADYTIFHKKSELQPNRTETTINIDQASIAQTGGSINVGTYKCDKINSCSVAVTYAPKDCETNLFFADSVTWEPLDTTDGENRTFLDVDPKSWYHKYITNLYIFGKNIISNKEIKINNIKYKIFNPSTYITRAELLKMIVKAKGIKDTSLPQVTTNTPKPFDDVDINTWYAPYIIYAKENNLIQGDSNTNNFRPNDSINRAEAIKIIVKASGKENITYSQQSPFNDVNNSSEWFYKYVLIGVKEGLIEGYLEDNGQRFFHPERVLTRGQGSKLISKAFNIIPIWEKYWSF